jgi:hypothetical protein
MKAAACENRRIRRPRGRPFARGNTTGHRWAKGTSGNPGGRPKTAAEVRARCRQAAELFLDRLSKATDARSAWMFACVFKILARVGGYPTRSELTPAQLARQKKGLDVLRKLDIWPPTSIPRSRS